MPELIFHVGDCKAGSTAIQSVLRDGSYTLSGPDAPRIAYAQAGRQKGLNHHRLSNSLFMTEAAEIRDMAWGRLGEEFRKTPADTLVVSSERFEFAEPSAVRDAIDELVPEAKNQVRIIAYVRPHADRIVSGFSQNVKQGLFSGTLPEFVEKFVEEGRFSYFERLSAWRAVFGTEVFEIRPMIRSQLAGQCVVHDFLTYGMGGRNSEVHVEKIPMPNASLGAEALDVLQEVRKRLNALNPAPNKLRGQLMERFGGNLEQSGRFSADRLALDAATAARVAELYSGDADACDAAFFDAQPLRTALDDKVAKRLSANGSATPDSEKVAAMAEISLVWFEMMSNLVRQSQRASRSGGGKPKAATQGQLARSQERPVSSR